MSLFLEYARSTELYRSLCGMFASDDGNLLEQVHDTVAEAQTEFLRWGLRQSEPRVIVETGTNKGMFAYLVSLVCRGVTLHTFDRDPRAARAIAQINAAQQAIVAVFHEGDSRQTLRELEVAVQFAWIDGGHEGDIPLSDLLQCYRLRVPYVAVDDTAFPSVRSAVDYVVEHTPYTVAGNPFLRHDRRGALLLRLEAEREACLSTSVDAT